MKDHYDVIGIGPDASEAEIRKAFRKSAKEAHPDLFPQDTFDLRRKRKKRFVQLIQAYEVLSDKERRRQYDLKRLLVHGSFTSSRNQNGNATASSTSRKSGFPRKTANLRTHDIPDSEEALNDLLDEVEGLLNSYGSGVRDPLDLLFAWAKNVFQETFDLWDDPGGKENPEADSDKRTTNPGHSKGSKEWFEELEVELNRLKGRACRKDPVSVSQRNRTSTHPVDEDIERELKRLKKKYQHL